jgi:hypothetical protein
MSYPPPAGVNFQRLRPYIEAALLEQKSKRVALGLARKLDRDEWRAIAQFNVVGWAQLCTVHWTNLGMEWADVEQAWEEVLRQHREGIFPDGPNDPGRRED